MKTAEEYVHFGIKVTEKSSGHTFGFTVASLIYNDFNIIDAIKKIKRINESKELYIKILKEPWLPNNELHDYMKPEIVGKWFDHVLNIKDLR